MANNPVVNSLTFTGSVAGQASIQAQGIAGGLTFMLPNTSPIVGQLVTVTAVNGNSVFLGWESQQSLSNIPLTALSTSGATSGDVIQYNGTNWAVSSFVPGSGTVTSVAVTVPAWLAVAGSPITGAGTIAITSAPSLTANWVLATPNGSAGVLAPRALVAADIPSLPYDASGAAAAVAAQLPGTFAAVTHEFLTSYTAGTPGVFTAAQPAFADLSGSLTIAQINSKQGNGNAVQLTNTGATVAGDVITYDANSNVVDSGTLLSSLATTASLSAYALKTGTVFSGNVEVETSLLLDASLTDNVASTGTSGQVLTAGTGGQVKWATPATAPVTSVFTRTGAVTAQSGDYSVGQVTGAAPLASPTFTGTVTTGIAQLAGTGARGVYVNLAPGPTDGVLIWSNAGNSEISISDSTGIAIEAGSGAVNVQASTTVTLNAPQNEAVLTNAPTTGDSSSAIATTSYVQAQGYAPLASPTFSGTVTVNTIIGAGSAITINSASSVTITAPTTISGNLFTAGAGATVSGGHITGNSDISSTAAITNPNTSVAVPFGTNYTGVNAPQVVVTAVGADPTALGGVWITNQGTSGAWTGFTINVTTTPSAAATFNYVVIGN